MSRHRLGPVASAVVLAALGSSGSCSAPTRAISMDYVAADLYAAPFPGEHLRTADGTVDVSHGPNPFRTAIVRQIHEALLEIDGFGTSSTIHFRLDGPIDSSMLPDTFSSTNPDAAVLLVDVDPTSPERGLLRPFVGFYTDDAGPYADEAHLLSLLPVQGVPLRASTLYAAVVTDRLRGADGEAIQRAPAMDDVLAGRVPVGMSPLAFESFRTAVDELRTAGIAIDRAVAMTAFRTGDPTAVLARAVESTEGRFAMRIEDPFVADEIFDDFCVFSGTVRMPVFQEGMPPYLTTGGGWVLDGDGVPVLQQEEEARIVVTVPRTAMPSAGYPTVVLSRTGAGGDRPLVDRGVSGADGVPLVPGTGPGLEFARSGFAGVMVDGPHGGLRNPDMGDEQFRVFNIQNPIALRDNLRQSAIELVFLARALDTLMVDASSCPGAAMPDGSVRFDTSHLALMGHSMGASIAPLAAAFEPRYGALILSGAGASWLENVIYKERPVATRSAAEALLRYGSLGRELTEDDVVLGLLQWAGESADAQLYARLLVDEPAVGGPRHILMFQGILDHYITPPIANALSLALGVDRAGPLLDTEFAQFTSIDELLPLRGRGGIDLPAFGNVTSGGVAVTAVVSQHAEDGIQDGHETMYQTEAPKAQYRCFLRTFARGEMPRVPDPDASDRACE